MGHVGFFDLHAVRGKCEIFVETGAGEGFSTQQLAKVFKRGVVIEINPTVAAAMRAKSLPGVVVVEGDSCKVLENILPSIQEPCLFWLDAHYPEIGQVVDFKHVPGVQGTRHPLVHELMAIFERDYDDVILIDDAHIYGGPGFESGGLPANYQPGTGLWELLDTCGRVVQLYFKDGGYIKITR